MTDKVRLDAPRSSNAARPWEPEIGLEWTTSPIAQLRLATEGTWTLFWTDSNNGLHRDSIDPTTQDDVLLALTADPANRYWR